MLPIREAAQQYIARDWQVVVLEEQGKKCLDADWLIRTYAPRDFGPTHNIGVKSVGGIVDVDCDCAEAIFMAEAFLPKTQAIYGRKSRPRSHWLFRCDDITDPVAHKDMVEKKTLLEIRVKHQSMAPPSVHPEGEAVEWDSSVAPYGVKEMTVEKALLQRAVQLVATGCMIARYYNPPGARHDWGVALAGVLRHRLGISEHEAFTLMTRAAAWARDDKSKDRLDAVRSTYAREESALTTGATKLKALIGEHGKTFVATLDKIWEADRDADVQKGILVQGGKLTEIVNRVETSLLTTPIYQRAGALIRPLKLDRAVGAGDEVRRQAGATVLTAVHEPWLVEQMGRVQKWFRPQGDSTLRIDPPPIYARTLLARGEWSFPMLRGVVTAPTLARDGRIIEKPGFDAASGLLVDITPNAFPSVPMSPTQDDALVALQRLCHPLRGFPFVDDASKAVALAALLTSLVRLSLRTAPLHVYDAPTAGTGKSMLAEMTGLLATGVSPPALSQGKSEEEDEKRLSTIMFAGDPVIHLDNCERPISGDFLCSMLTQEVVQARILGHSERRVLPSTALVLASGNNIVLAGDTSRRAVMCRLDAQVERPDTRVFDFDCHAEVLSARSTLVVAGLTVLRAYEIAGRPETLTPMGSFADWEWIRGALVWLGCADPAETRASILASDPRKDELITVLDAWEMALGEMPVEVGDIAKRADDPNTRTDAIVALRDALVGAACRGGVWNAKSIGWWLRKYKDRIVGGRCLRGEQVRDKQRWSLATSGAQRQFEVDR